MSKISIGRLILGGIIAGLIINLFEDILNGVVLAKQWTAVMASLGHAPMATSGIIAFNVLGFILGFAAIWVYAAIRPRFGAGMRTAFYAALCVWVIGYVVADSGPAILGLFSPSLMITLIAIGFFEIVAATLAGAYFYKEASLSRSAVQ
jgi:hypothetical protein